MTASTKTNGACALTPGEATPPAVASRWRLAGHWGGNIVLALLLSRFAWNAYHQWAHTGSLVLLGLVLYNTLLVTMTIARRPSVSTSTQIKDWTVALVTVWISLMLWPEGSQHFFAQAAGFSLQATGLLVMVVASATLGRSFGVVAANRGIKHSGIYGWMRHPLYAGEMVFFTGFLLSNTSPYNLILWFGIVCGQSIRAWAEENHLRQDDVYQAYMQAVPYRFVPGLF